MAIENLTGFDLISDVGDTANSYASVAGTRATWELDPYKVGTTLTDDEIGKALLLATKQLDLKYGSKYKGSLYDESYALFFPRIGLYDARGVSIDDYTVFPSDIILATSTQAWYAAATNRQAESTVNGVKKNQMDGLGSQEFFSPGIQQSLTPSVIADEVYDIMKPYINGGSGRYVSLLGRG